MHFLGNCSEDLWHTWADIKQPNNTIKYAPKPFLELIKCSFRKKGFFVKKYDNNNFISKAYRFRSHTFLV